MFRFGRLLLLCFAALLAGGAAMAQGPARQEATMHHAAGTFEVTITPEAQAGPPFPDALPTARMALAKVFHGPFAGTATGTMLAAGAPGSGRGAAYVAIDQVTGTLHLADGRALTGGFVLVHRGTMSAAGAPDLTVAIAPDSGTGALAGIAGTLAITVADGVHHYDLAFTLPDG